MRLLIIYRMMVNKGELSVSARVHGEAILLGLIGEI